MVNEYGLNEYAHEHNFEMFNFDELNESLRGERFFVVDEKVLSLYGERLCALEGKHVYLVKNPEGEKSFEGYQALMEFLLSRKITRKDKLVAIGGGAVGDLAGFAASTVLRGIDWICVPTTLLSMIDSSIGGKTGINTKAGKNLIGSFHQPVSIPVVVDFLNTLEPIEMESGKGELLKYAFLDKRVYQALKEETPFEKTIHLCRQVKMEIVEKDFKESGERAKLNLGHTFGHVLEKMTGMPHGIAVALGLEMIIDLFSPELAEDLISFRESLGVAPQMPSALDAKTFWNMLSLDKKSSGTKLNMIIPKTGAYSVIEPYSIQELQEKLENCEKYKRLLK